jgi:hypothetical protein
MFALLETMFFIVVFLVTKLFQLIYLLCFLFQKGDLNSLQILFLLFLKLDKIKIFFVLLSVFIRIKKPIWIVMKMV